MVGGSGQFMRKYWSTMVNQWLMFITFVHNKLHIAENQQRYQQRLAVNGGDQQGVSTGYCKYWLLQVLVIVSNGQLWSLLAPHGCLVVTDVSCCI